MECSSPSIHLSDPLLMFDESAWGSSVEMRLRKVEEGVVGVGDGVERLVERMGRVRMLCERVGRMYE